MYFFVLEWKIPDDGNIKWYRDIIYLYLYYQCLSSISSSNSINSSLNNLNLNPNKIKIIYNGLLTCLLKKELIKLDKFSFTHSKIDGNLMKILVKLNFNDCDTDYVINYKSNRDANSKQIWKSRSVRSCKGIWVTVHCLYIFKMIEILSMRHPHFFYILKISHARTLKSLF